jgi:hypothetical protein
MNAALGFLVDFFAFFATSSPRQLYCAMRRVPQAARSAPLFHEGARHFFLESAAPKIPLGVDSDPEGMTRQGHFPSAPITSELS